jgi:hypothetical protein
MRQELQYIELPNEEPARTIWLKLTEARGGKEPYAIFQKRSPRTRWLMVHENCAGWVDAEMLIAKYERDKASGVSECKPKPVGDLDRTKAI